MWFNTLKEWKNQKACKSENNWGFYFAESNSHKV